MYEFHYHLNKCRTIKEIQDQFSGWFPFLRIHFFKGIKPGTGLSEARVILFSPEMVLKDLNPKITDGEQSVRESMTVLELENHFYDMFGLSAQILRKSGNLWLDTSRSNSWTLKDQNEYGREIFEDRTTNLGIVKGPGTWRSPVNKAYYSTSPN